jgi:hypothetical protein
MMPACAGPLADLGVTWWDRNLGQPLIIYVAAVAGQAGIQAPAALTCSVKVFQVSGAKASWGPFGCLLSRTATAGPVVPTSTQAPPLLPL